MSKTVKLILNHYPIKSIRKISNPWGQCVWKTAGHTLSLDHIEHKILRREFKEPRIHFAFVCASIGSPEFSTGLARISGRTKKRELLLCSLTWTNQQRIK